MGEWHLPKEEDLPADELALIRDAMSKKTAALAAGNKPSTDVVALADERWNARTAKDWAQADVLRDELHALGWKVLDGKDGYELEPV